MKTKILIKGWRKLIAFSISTLLVLAAFAAPAYAAPTGGVTAYAVGGMGGNTNIEDESSNLLADNCVLQFINAGANGIADTINSDRTPGGDDSIIGVAFAVGDGTFDAPGTFIKTTGGLADGTKLYVRAFNATTTAAANKYGDSSDAGASGYYTIVGGEPEPPPPNWEVPDFATTKDIPTDQPALDVSPASLTFNATEGGANPADQGLNVTNTGSGALTWNASKAQSWLTISPTSGTAPSTITVSVDITGLTAAGSPYTDTISVTSNGGNQNVTLTLNVSPIIPTDPNITSISLATAEVGQTIVISGTNFDADGEVWFGGVIGVPTVWGDTSITIAVPSGVDTGTVEVSVENAAGSDSEIIEIPGEKIYIEDFEGGAVGNFTEPATLSGYYVFENSDDITPNNNDINAELRNAGAAYDSNLGAMVRYSYNGTDGTDWGGGWGAKLANTLDLDSVDEISIFSKWDGTANQVKLNLKDSDGTAVASTIDNAILANLDVYGEVTLPKSSFSVDDDASDPNDDDNFNWEEVSSYNLVYDGQETTTEYHYLDTITANITQAPTGEGIYNIEPASGPAGTRVTVTGNGFGDMQGQSMLVFDNDQSGVSYQAREILSWSNTQIVAVVPRLAASGDYKVKVIKITIIQGTTRAWQSNEVNFRVTASAATEGGIATIFPNPFNPLAETVTVTGTGVDANRNTIAFNAGSSTTVGIYIYDMTARLIQHRTVTMGTADTDVQALGWDGSQAAWSGYDMYENLAGDGVYIMKIIDQDSKRVIAKGKILVIKK